MIIDIGKFINHEEKQWKEFEEMLDHYSKGRAASWNVDQLKRFYYLFQKVSSDLNKITTFSGEREIKKYLENLVARGYSVVHSGNEFKKKFSLKRWIFSGFPGVFRKNIKAFYLSLAITILGFLFGGVMILADADAKKAIYPEQFGHLMASPGARVEKEEKTKKNKIAKHHNSFAASLITHNTKVSVNMVAFGITWGIGTILLLFYNGVILGAVVIEYIASGYSSFVFGWLLPHGVIEIPAILIAGQAGLMIGNCVLRPGRQSRLKKLRSTMPDIVTLIAGVAMLLIWAGLVESFFSQYHGNIIPYSLKIGFGITEFIVLFYYLFQKRI